MDPHTAEAMPAPSGVQAKAREGRDIASSIIGEIEVFEDSISDSPDLYDLSDLATKKVYDESVKNVSPGTQNKDRVSNTQIVTAVKEAVAMHGSGGIIIISGAGVHIWGAISYLQNNNKANYYGITTNTLQIGTVVAPGRKANLEDIKAQTDRSIAVLKASGYRDIQDFRDKSKAHKYPENIIVGLEETGLHEAYTDNFAIGKEKVYLDAVEKLIEGINPNFVLFIGKDGSPEDTKSTIKGAESPSDMPIIRFLKYISSNFNVPIEIARFGDPVNP